MVKITQKEQVSHILNVLLGKKPCSIIEGDEEHVTGFVSFAKLSTGSEVKLRTQLTDFPKERRFLIRHNDKEIVSVCRFVTRKGPIEILSPQYIEIREQAVASAAKSGAADRFYASNLTSYNEIAAVLESNRKKVNGYVVNFFEEELSGMVKYHKIYLNSGDSTDPRMRQLIKTPRIIYYAENLGSDFDYDQYFPVQVYRDEIVRRDMKTPRNMKNEITIPVLYRGKIPFGYIQANSDRPMQTATFQALKKVAMSIESQLRKLNLPFEELEMIPINSIDMQSITFELTNRGQLRHFQEGQLLYFKLVKNNEELGQFAAEVSSRTAVTSGMSTSSAVFLEMDAISELNLEEALG